MKIKPLEKKKKPNIAALRRKADRLYQELGRKMYKTSYSGKEYSCLHHDTPKGRSSALRYEIKNGVPISAGEHLQYHSASDPDIRFNYKLFMEDKWGKDWEIELRQQRFANKDLKTNVAWYKANIEMLQGMIDAYKDESSIDNF